MPFKKKSLSTRVHVEEGSLYICNRLIYQHHDSITAAVPNVKAVNRGCHDKHCACKTHVAGPYLRAELRGGGPVLARAQEHVKITTRRVRGSGEPSVLRPLWSKMLSL
jgi:hypothetical protein